MGSLSTLAVFGVLLGVVVVIPAFWYLVVFTLSHVSGWQHLAGIYLAQTPPAGKRLGLVSGSVGAVSYRNALIIHVVRSGFFLEVPFLLRIGHKPLFIPWVAISSEKEIKFLWHRAVRFQIGTPPCGEIQLPTTILEARHASVAGELGR